MPRSRGYVLPDGLGNESEKILIRFRKATEQLRVRRRLSRNRIDACTRVYLVVETRYFTTSNRDRRENDIGLKKTEPTICRREGKTRTTGKFLLPPLCSQIAAMAVQRINETK